MNEIKYNQSAENNLYNKLEQQTHGSTKNIFKVLLKKIFKIFLIVIFLTVIIYGINLVKDKYFEGEDNKYTAVFLTNGQVYFGNMVDNSDNEIVLNNVYYLQAKTEGVSEQGVNALAETSFNLVKLGNELHGPTDELFVNKTHVIFYEYLRDDSKVVESIKKL